MNPAVFAPVPADPIGEQYLPSNPPAVPAVFPPMPAVPLPTASPDAKWLIGSGKASSNPPAIVDELRKAKWTMLVGDSVVLIQFLELANQIRPSCAKIQDEMIRREAPNPLQYMWNEVNEYSLICKKNGVCDFKHIDCMHLNLAHNCPSSEPVQCKFISQRECSLDEWTTMVDDIHSEDTDYAVTFHWVPISVARKAPDINRFEHDTISEHNVSESLFGTPSPVGLQLFSKRMQYAHNKVGAIIMNSCLHSYASPLLLEEQAFDMRLDRFQEIVTHNLDLFLLPEWADFSGPLIFQGCPRLDCKLAPSAVQCGSQQKELRKVDGMFKRLARHHPAASQITFLDANMVQSQQPDNIVYPDDRHPCWIRPCSWDLGCQRGIASEQEELRKAYTVAYASYAGHNKWYEEHAAEYQELRAIAERDTSSWYKTMQADAQKKHMPPGSTANANSVEPVILQDEVASAAASYNDLLGLKQWVASEAQLVQSTFALAPQSYSNNEGACPALRNAWGLMLAGRVRGLGKSAGAAVSPVQRGSAAASNIPAVNGSLPEARVTPGNSSRSASARTIDTPHAAAKASESEVVPTNPSTQARDEVASQQISKKLTIRQQKAIAAEKHILTERLSAKLAPLSKDRPSMSRRQFLRPGHWH